MPEKTQATRAKQAKKKGTTLQLKASDVGAAYGESPHHAKKSSGKLDTAVTFADRNVSPRSPPGKGATAKSRKLPVVGGGSSTSRRKTLPTVAAAAYRKSGAPKRTTGRGDVSPLQAGKAYAPKSRRMRNTKKQQT